MDRSSSISTSREQNSSQASRTYKSVIPGFSAPTSYESVFSDLQTRLREEHDKGNHQEVTQDELKVVIGIFQFAETNRPLTGFGALSRDEIEYRAEFNTWCYYFDEPSLFPGIAASPPSSIAKLSNRALATKANLLKILSSQKEFGPDYQPQMGWDPATGEPWLSFHCKARNAYPAISGPYNRHAKEVEKCVPEFKVMFQRFRKDGFVLIWPEFASQANLSSPSAWERFAKFRAFLLDWSEKRGELEHINDACRKWCQIPSAERKSEPLPEDFRLTTLIRENKKKDTEQMGMSQETLVNQSQEYDSWKPEPGSYEREDVRVGDEDELSRDHTDLEDGNVRNNSANTQIRTIPESQDFDAARQRNYRDRDNLNVPSRPQRFIEASRDDRTGYRKIHQERHNGQETYRRRSRSPRGEGRAFDGHRQNSGRGNRARGFDRNSRDQSRDLMDRDNRITSRDERSKSRYQGQNQDRRYNQGRADDVFRSTR